MRQRKETAYPKRARSSNRAPGPPYALAPHALEDDLLVVSRQGSGSLTDVAAVIHHGYQITQQGTCRKPYWDFRQPLLDRADRARGRWPARRGSDPLVRWGRQHLEPGVGRAPSAPWSPVRWGGSRRSLPAGAPARGCRAAAPRPAGSGGLHRRCSPLGRQASGDPARARTGLAARAWPDSYGRTHQRKGGTRPKMVLSRLGARGSPAAAQSIRGSRLT